MGLSSVGALAINMDLSARFVRNTTGHRQQFDQRFGPGQLENAGFLHSADNRYPLAKFPDKHSDLWIVDVIVVGLTELFL